MEQEWFEMPEVRRRRLIKAVWIPLRASEVIEEVGDYGYVGYKKEFFGVTTLAVPLDRKKDTEKLTWSDVGLIHDAGHYVLDGRYKPAEIYEFRDGDNFGVELVMEQHFNSLEARVWHLNQDIVFALNLLRDGDVWVSPNEAYERVARLRRDSNGRPIAIEIRSEFLQDYLAARNMGLFLCSYRSRREVLENADQIPWEEYGKEETGIDQFARSKRQILQGGHPADASFAVFRVWRTDVDSEEDVPEFGPESNENTDGSSSSGTHKGKVLFDVEGELWRNEWLEPAPTSIRVRGDRIATGLQYVVDAAGRRESSEKLDDEDIGRYLWFRPDIVLAALSHHGSALSWYTQDTGDLRCSPDYRVHFGVNPLGLLTVYAYDIARLPRWQQQIWAGFNVTPEGGVSKELLSAQMETKPANTTAPEAIFSPICEELDGIFVSMVGTPLFRKHASTAELFSKAHRFRGVEHSGVLALSKDLTRLVADRLDVGTLRKCMPSPPAGKDLDSLKMLEAVVATASSEKHAKPVLSFLFGAYELRLADAHLPPSELSEAYAKVQVDPNSPRVIQGFNLIASVVSSLIAIRNVLTRPTTGTIVESNAT